MANTASMTHTIRFHGQRWTCSCHARGTGTGTAEAHAVGEVVTIEMGALR